VGVPRVGDSVRDAWETVIVDAIRIHGVHPIAFVARNSHASYPSPCFGGCRQETRDLPEAEHDGVVPWAHNNACTECVKPLPLTLERQPALWNAFPGHWGEQACILAGAYCDLSGAPTGPALQRRYKDPARVKVEQICLTRTSSGPPLLDPCPSSD
jgi:hypothetical protein